MNTLIYKRIRARRMRFIKRLALSAIFLAAAFAVAEHASAEADILLETSGYYSLYKARAKDTCYVLAPFNNGSVVVGFIFHNTGFPIMLVVNTSWNLSEGRHPVNFEIDSLGEWTGEAVVDEGEKESFSVKITFETLKQISQGKQLKIEAGTWHKSFPLKGTSATLKGLAKCSANRLGTEASNPFGDQPIKDAVNPFVDL